MNVPARLHAIYAYPFILYLQSPIGVVAHNMNTDRFLVVRTKDLSHFLISKEPPECISYEPTNSFFLGLGIENSTAPVEQDVKSIAECVSRTVLPRSNVSVKVTSSNAMACVASQIAKEFKRQASQVRRDGIFMFYYAGAVVQISEDRYSLVSSDFDSGDHSTFITAETLVSWLKDIQSEAKEVLMIFSCQFADKIASAFYKNLLQSINISAIALPVANAQTTILSPLKCSTCNYFLCQAINTTFASSGIFQLKRIYDKTVTCCGAFSELIVTYDPVLKCLNRQICEPTLAATRKPQYISRILEGDEVDGGRVPGNLSFLAKHFIRGVTGPSNASFLHHYVDVWLQSAENLETGPLAVLRHVNALSEEVISAVVCVLMSSLASIQVAFEPASAGSTNLVIIAFMRVSATVTSMCPEASVGAEHFKLSCQCYSQVLSACGLDTKSVRGLCDKVCQETNV